MSWQSYVDDHLMCDIDGQHLTAAAIIGHDGSVWAQSSTFPQFRISITSNMIDWFGEFKPEEIAAIMKDFDEPGSLAPTGLHLGGIKYMVIMGEQGAVIRGKKGAGGITVKKTGAAMIFGIYDEPMTPGQCNIIVERIQFNRKIMSWQSYVDDHLMCDIDGQHLTAAAIIGHDGSVWAQSSTFPQFRISITSNMIDWFGEFKPEEIAAIMKDFDEPGSLAPTGLHLGGIKYMVIMGEQGAVIRGKKGAGGITVKKTGAAMIFGIYDEPMTPGQCNIIVERLGDYLIDQNL
ncbi:hypothetical protein G4B88_019809 [Cannabis sativa]|uniref:Profilin n=1 Tax=Cannabis sativa TaxID=3483 RepID=A0A7J6HTU8_CANSA|nr:hypothetical protein G4B88_019809 [Cannabis sativa]